MSANGNGAGPHVNGTKPVSHDPDYWLGHLAAAIGEALELSPTAGKTILRGALRRFLESPFCSHELRRLLKGEAHEHD